jgi:hypothetical protein
VKILYENKVKGEKPLVAHKSLLGVIIKCILKAGPYERTKNY